MTPSRACLVVLLVFVALGVGRAGDETAQPLDEVRKANEKAYAAAKEALHRDHPGEWVVIANGEVVAIAKGLDEVLPAAPDARHRFVFLVGEEGDGRVPANFWYGPRFSGLRLPSALGFGVTINEGDWKQEFFRKRDGSVHRAGSGGPLPRTAVQVCAPGETPETLDVFIGTVGPPLMLTPGDFVRLGLARFEVPGTWTALDRVPCRRVLVRVAFPGIQGEAHLVATVPTVPHERLVDMQRGRDYRHFPASTEGHGVWAMVPEVHRKGWVLLGVDRVLGWGNTPAEALRAGESQAPETPHRYLSSIPQQDAMVLDAAEYAEEVELVLDGEKVCVRKGPKREGPRIFLADEATARRLRLELAEEVRCIFVKCDDALLHARMGAAWVGQHRLGESLPESAPTPELVWVVYPLPKGKTVWHCEPPPELTGLPSEGE